MSPVALPVTRRGGGGATEAWPIGTGGQTAGRRKPQFGQTGAFSGQSCPQFGQGADGPADSGSGGGSDIETLTKITDGLIREARLAETQYAQHQQDHPEYQQNRR